MKKIFFIIFALLLSVGVCDASDYYIAQSAAGSGNGSNCANADAIADLTWGGGNMVDAGDTLHLCGTITSTLTIGASGSEGSVITVAFESGAKFSKAAWGTTSSAAIYATGKDYITIDGQTNGIIENTDNGTALGTQQQSHGVYVTGGSNWTIQDLTIKEIYARTPRSNTDSNDYGVGINTKNVSLLTVDGNTIYGAYYCLVHTATSGNPSGLTINDNDLSQMSTGIKIALDGATNYSSIIISNNKIYDTYVWDGAWGGSWFHRDGIHTWGNYAANSLGSITISGNEFSGDWGVSAHVTAFIYLTDYTFPAVIYNNLFVPTTGTASNGYIDYHCYSSDGDVKVYNNTFDGPSSTSAGYNAIYVTGLGGGTADIYNNIIKDVYIAIYDNSTNNFVITADNNDYYNLTSVGRDGDPDWYETIASWRTFLGGCPNAGNDCDSITDNPSLDANFRPDSGDDPVVETGYDTSAIVTTDKDGVARPQGTAVDMGAYEFIPEGQASGTIIPGGCTESEIVTGGKTIIITLSGDSFIAAGTGPIGTTANTQALIDGIDGDVVAGTGWDAQVKANLVPADDVVRDSNTQCTITLNPAASYEITSNETVTVTIPAEVLTGAVEIVATPTFQISAEQIAAETISAVYNANGPALIYNATGIGVN